MTLTLYTTTSPDNKVVKELAGATTLENVQAYNIVDVLNPSFILTNDTSCNYFLWKGRYYFGRVSYDGRKRILTGTVDPLMSNSSGIQNITARLIRQESVNEAGKYISDNLRTVTQKRTVKLYAADGGFDFSKSGDVKYLMITK